mgnify:CR=1 FL=1
MSEPTGEYLFAKAELCYTLAQKQLEEMRIAEAIKNIERANRAIARIFNLDDTSFGNCDKCWSWCDCLENGICQTCIKDGEGNE